jgi:hypothetical protein
MTATSFTLGTTTTMAQMPTAVLTATGNVDLYKLATYNLSGIAALSDKINDLDTRMTSLETRVAALENGSISSSSSLPAQAGSLLSTSTLANALSGFGVLIQKGISQFGVLVADQFVAATNSSGTSSAGTVTILAGNTVAQVMNSYVNPDSKIFVTLTASTTGSWYISDKENGFFKLVLSEPQTNDVSFDYFIVQIEGQIATSTPETATSSSQQITTPAPIITSADNNTSSSSNDDTASSTSTTTQTSNPSTSSGSSATPSTTPPVVTLNGAAAMQINQGDTFIDPGATAVDPSTGSGQAADLTAKIVETGSVDTTTVGIYTLTYSVTDSAGNVGNASRVVTVIASIPTSGVVGTTTSESVGADSSGTSSSADATITQ